MKRWFILSTAVALLAGTLAVAGDDGGKPDGDRPHPKQRGLLPPRALQELNLTAEQQAKYKELNEQFVKERDAWLAAHKGEGEPAREEFEAAREAGDRAKLDALRQKRHDAMQPLVDLRHKYMDQFRAVLTPQQIKKLDEARERREDRREDRRDRRGPPPED
jgi:Spy/CpxP family protein refolding chaperone